MVQVGERVIDHISLSVQREFEGFTFHSITGFQDIAVTTITDDTEVVSRRWWKFEGGVISG